MKRLLILLFVFMLILAGCSTGDNINVNTDKTLEVSELEGNEEIELENSNNEEEDEKFEPSNETAEETMPEEDKTAKEVTIEEPVTEELPIEELPAEEQINDNNKNIENENVLKIKGLVDNELILTLNDLKAMNDIIFEADFYSLNSYGTRGYTHFKGVKLWDLLESKALIKPDAAKITIIAQDGYSIEFTIEQVKMEYIDETNPDTKYPVIIAWEENSEEYSIDEGAPYKLIVGQKEPGDVNKPQWVSNIDVIIIE